MTVKSLIDFFQRKPLFWISGHIRPLILLRLVKFASNLPAGFLLAGLYDPNTIRKKVNIVFKQKLVPLKSYGGDFLVDVNEHLGYRFFINNGFDPLVLRVSELLEIDEKSILLDIGANIGSTCIPFAIRFNAEVIAVEASKQNACLLLKNASLNKVKIWLNIVCAVDPVTARDNNWIQFFSKNGNSAANSIFDSWNPSKATSDYEFTRTTTIDAILSDIDLKRIKIMKLDVEGAEAMVLKGFRKLSEIQAPLLFEYRIDVMKRDLDQDGSEIIKLLDGDFSLFGVDECKGKLFLTPFEPMRSYANAIALPKSNIEYFMKRFSLKSAKPPV